MPNLHFKGKTFVQNHHLAVPYHQLLPQKQKSNTEKTSLNDNLIIHGDNLLALKALLPTYSGRIKCIYIDPPYNTGKEKWVYNDNVNSPIIKEWIGKVVGKEGEDLVRHDKWLCMMMPRLKLLRELLKPDGMVFISIDDHEFAHLRTLMDEIFGSENFVATFVRQVIKGGTGPSDEIRKTHDYVLAYAKNKQLSDLYGMEIDALELDLEDEKGAYRKGRELNKWGAGSKREDSPTMWFPIPGPNKEDVYPIRNDGSEGRWRWGKKKILNAVKNGDVIFEPRGDGTYIVYEKIRDDNPRRKAFSTLELTNAQGTEELKAIFNGKSPFDYPKPPSLIKFLISLCANEDGDIILDSFAGSGTTGQAVLESIHDDGVERNFILIEMEDYADSITAERIRRISKGVPNAKKVSIKKGLGGSFTFFELGDALALENLLSGKNLPSLMELSRYIFYTATGEEFTPEKLNPNTGFIGSTQNFDVYVFYEPDLDYLKTTALTLNKAREIRHRSGSKPLLIFAPTKYLDQQRLDELGITFAQLPFEIYRMK